MAAGIRRAVITASDQCDIVTTDTVLYNPLEDLIQDWGEHQSKYSSMSARTWIFTSTINEYLIPGDTRVTSTYQSIPGVL